MKSTRKIAIFCLLLLVFISFNTISFVWSQLMTCPQVCSCIWRNGKQTTICENQNLISIPNQISPSTQVLDLNNNNFHILPSKAFQERGLINLQKLFLPNCKLGAIADDAFHQLTNLVELDLSDNLLTHVPVKALANATNLRRLLLNNNHIATITAESFAALSNLKFLNLSGCKTHTIEARAFYGLRDLEYLYLHNNQLTTLPYTVVVDLPALYSFELYRNPWQCNCEMRATREWMIRNNVGQSIPPTCDQPIRLSGLMWNSLDLDDFACQPDIITTTVEVTKVVGSNATLSCVVKGLPEPKVFWYMDHGYYNISSNHPQRSHKYHLTEERNEGMVNSLLTIIGLELSDDGTSFICSAENRAGVKSKNFTVYVMPSGTFGVAANWSKIELAGGLLGLLITLVLAFVVITLILIRSKRFPLYHGCKSGSQSSNQDPNDSLDKKKGLAKMLNGGSNNSTIYPNSNGTVGNMAYGMQQHLSMLGLDGIDKKPEIFLKPTPAMIQQQQQQQPDLVTTKSHHLANPITGYELDHFNNGQGMAYLNDLNHHQDTLFVSNDGQQYYHGSNQTDTSGLYRAVMVPPSVMTSSTTLLSSAPQTNSSTMTQNGPTRSSPPTFLLSAPSLYNQYLSQYDLSNQQPPQLQQRISTPPNHQFFSGQQQFLPQANSPSPRLVSAYGNPGFVSDSSFAQMYGDNSGDDDDVFRPMSDVPNHIDHQLAQLAPLHRHLNSNITTTTTTTMTPSPPPFTAPRQSTTLNLNLVNKIEEPIYVGGMRRPPIPTPINHFVNGGSVAPMQMAPPAPTQQSIYGVTTMMKNRWNSGGSMTPNPHFLQPQSATIRNQMTTSLSNIRCSPDEGYGEESSTGPSVGQLEGTEV